MSGNLGKIKNKRVNKANEKNKDISSQSSELSDLR